MRSFESNFDFRHIELFYLLASGRARLLRPSEGKVLVPLKSGKKIISDCQKLNGRDPIKMEQMDWRKKWEIKNWNPKKRKTKKVVGTKHVRGSIS